MENVRIFAHCHHEVDVVDAAEAYELIDVGLAAIPEVQIRAVRTQKGTHVGTGRVSHDADVLRIASVLGDVLFDPSKGLCRVRNVSWVLDGRGEPVVHQDRAEAVLGEMKAYVRIHRFAAARPPASVNEKKHRRVWLAREDVHFVSGMIPVADCGVHGRILQKKAARKSGFLNYGFIGREGP